MWTPTELSASWSLTFDELSLLTTKPPHTSLGLCIQLKFYQNSGRFPLSCTEVPDVVIDYLGEQLGIETSALDRYAWSGRSGRRHRKAILKYLGVRRPKSADKGLFLSWLRDQVCPLGLSKEAMLERGVVWFRQQRLLCPSDREVEQSIGIARRQFEQGVFKAGGFDADAADPLRAGGIVICPRGGDGI